MNSLVGQVPGSSEKTVDHAYYPAFDYLRFVLAMTVVFSHSGLIAWDGAGGFAVQVFFALSGWLIGGILLRSKPTDLPQFYFNRAARIWIPYYIGIFLLMAASLLKDQVTQKWIEIFSYDLTFVYNLFGPPQLAEFKDAMPLQGTGNHFWSICAEEQFYLVAPLIITSLPRFIGQSVVAWIIITLVVISSPYSYLFGAISCGVLAAVLQHRFPALPLINYTRVLLVLITIATFAPHAILPYRFGAPLTALCIVLSLSQPGQHSKIAKFLGGMSFPLYLNAWIGGFIVNMIFHHFNIHASVIHVCVSLVFETGVAAVLYLTIDRNLMKYRSRYFSKGRGISVAITSFMLVAVGVIFGVIMNGGRLPT